MIYSNEINIGSPLIDLAFFLYSSAYAKNLTAYENEFVRFYYSCICQYGVIDYTFDECIRDYKCAKEIALMRRIILTYRRMHGYTDRSNVETDNSINLINLAVKEIINSYDFPEEVFR